jgi:hypothetical protein
MMTLREQILALISKTPGLTDREITDKLKNRSTPEGPVHQACLALERKGILLRKNRFNEGIIGNYLISREPSPASILPQPSRSTVSHSRPSQFDVLSLKPIDQDYVKGAIETWLVTSGWTVTFALGRQRGLEIEATRSGAKWVIEARGQGKDNPMGGKYFPHVLGSIVQRMDDPGAKYSLAFPEIEPFTGMWRLLPALAKSRLGVTVLFVGASGRVTEMG